MSDDRLPPNWELEMMSDLAGRWGISLEEAEVYLEEIGAFGPKSEWPSTEDADA